MKKVLGVDSSTQSVKVVVRDAESGELIKSASRPHPDGTEVDPRHWFDALTDAIAEVGGLNSVDAISIAGQQHGMIVLDESGEVIRPALLWNDTRSSSQAEALNNEIPDIHKRVGSKLVASFTASKLKWLQENEPENAKKVRAVALPHDWLSWKISGSKNLEDIFTDRSDASGTGYFNPFTNAYELDILKSALGHTNIHLPKLVAPNSFGFNNGSLKLAAGAGDNAGAALGLGAQVGDLVISLGTSGTAYLISSSGSSDASGEVAGFADATGNFLPLACTLNAAKVFATTSAMLGISFDEFSRLALSAKSGAEGLVFLPHLDGERTPNRPEAKGQLHNITHSNFTAANVCRASIEGVIGSMAYATQALLNLGHSFERIIVIGGAARNPAVQQIAADLFAHEIVVPAESEYVADGAAKQAAWALSGDLQPPHWESRGSQVIQPLSKNPGLLESYLQAISRV
ncbi:MAG: xylulokinase [Actinobacteria bacterium]|nr:xylulokinase [Actinomycetota bacterium]